MLAALPPPVPGTLIAPDNIWSVWLVILAGVAFAIYGEQKWKWAAKLSGPVLALLIAMLLTNVGVMPQESPVYGVIFDYLVPLAVPLLLFRANIGRIIKETGSLFVAFHISALGTVLGGLLAFFLLHGQLEEIMIPEVEVAETEAAGTAQPPETPEPDENAADAPERSVTESEVAQMAATMTGSYTGGGVNFAALKTSFDLNENLASPLIVADNFIMALLFVTLFWMAGSKFFLKRFRHPFTSESAVTDPRVLASEHWKAKKISLLHIATALAIAAVIAGVSVQIAEFLEADLRGDDEDTVNLPALLLGNAFLWMALIATIVATAFHRPLDKIHGADELGTFFLYIFLFAIGLPADLKTVLFEVPVMFLFCLIIAVVNLAVTLGLGRLFKLPFEELLVAVNANLGGAPSAVAMSVAKGWKPLVLPSLLIGIWGYVVGTLLGLLLYSMIAPA